MQSNMENCLERSDTAVSSLKLSKINEYLKEFYNFFSFEIKYESSKMQSNMENCLERSDTAINSLEISKNNEYLKEFLIFSVSKLIPNFRTASKIDFNETKT